MSNLIKYLEKTFPVVFFLAVFFFFSFPYKYHLHYQEQLQMFLFTSDYWSDLISRPGGLADYLGTFFTQFYYYDWLGALIIAALLSVLQIQVKLISNKLSKSQIFSPLTFIPSLVFWGILCDENFLLAGLIAVVMVLIAVQLYISVKNSLLRFCLVVLMIPALFYLAGGAYWVFGIFVIVLELLYFKQTKIPRSTFLIVTIGLILILPFSARYFVQYPLSRIWWGICYNRYPVVSPLPLLTVWALIIAIPVLFRFITFCSNESRNAFFFLFQVLVVIAVGIGIIHSSADSKKEEIMAYDYNIRVKNWEKVISMANHKDPDTPLSVTCLNLALSKSGTMGDCMFRYFQNGPEGLLPSFQRDFTIPFIAGEVYYHLGFLNTSLRYAFEAMEAIPDYKKSVRAMQRMAEVNLLNGEYKVAEKYLHLLQYTLFYSKWADETLACVGNEKKINQNPEWALLRKNRVTKDFLFSEDEKDQMLGMLLIQSKTNKMAFEYLMAYTLLAKDLEHFVKYFPLGKNIGYREIPAHYQEALIYLWENSSHIQQTIPWNISQAIRTSLDNYSRLYSAGPGTSAAIQQAFGQTYWYYFHFRN